MLRVLPVFIFYTRGLVAGGAEEAEEVDEEVDEVEVEGEGADSGEFAVAFVGCYRCHLFDFLSVPCGEAEEYQYAGK